MHVERGLCGKLSWKHRGEVVKRMNRLRAVQGLEAGEEAFCELLGSSPAAPARPSAGQQSGLAAQQGFSYQLSISHTAEDSNDLTEK